MFWEATDYCNSMPYKEIDNSNLSNLLRYKLTNELFLEKPDSCPDELYGVMLKCWEINKEKRITFSQLVIEMKAVIVDLYGTF